MLCSVYCFDGTGWASVIHQAQRHRSKASQVPALKDLTPQGVSSCLIPTKSGLPDASTPNMLFFSSWKFKTRHRWKKLKLPKKVWAQLRESRAGLCTVIREGGSPGTQRAFKFQFKDKNIKDFQSYTHTHSYNIPPTPKQIPINTSMQKYANAQAIYHRKPTQRHGCHIFKDTPKLTNKPMTLSCL